MHVWSRNLYLSWRVPQGFLRHQADLVKFILAVVVTDETALTGKGVAIVMDPIHSHLLDCGTLLRRGHPSSWCLWVRE